MNSDCLALCQHNVSEWSEISLVDYCFTIGIQLSMFI